MMRSCARVGGHSEARWGGSQAVLAWKGGGLDVVGGGCSELGGESAEVGGQRPVGRAWLLAACVGIGGGIETLGEISTSGGIASGQGMRSGVLGALKEICEL
jgi:hypothetical protein